MKKSLILALVAILLAGCGRPGALSTQHGDGAAFAEVGNGGHGVVHGGKVYLVDLVEAGVETAAQVGDREPQHPFNFAGQLKEGSLVNNDDAGKPLFPYAEVGAKLAQIDHHDRVLAMALLETMRMYQWNMVDRDLSKLPLRGGILNLAEGSVQLIANRRGRSIYLSLPLFRLMDPAHRAATILHEALYALIKPVRIEKEKAAQLTQNAPRVREIVGYLFSQPNFQTRDRARRLAEILGDDEFPIGGRDVYRAAFAASVQPDRTSRRELIFNPRMTVTPVAPGAKDAAVGRALDSWSTPTALAGPIFDHLTALGPKADHLKHFFYITLNASDEPGPKGLSLRFGQYQEDRETKTYVEAMPLQSVEPATARVLRLRGGSIEQRTEAFLVSVWAAFLRSHPSFSPSEDQAATTAFQTLLSNAKDGDKLLHFPPVPTKLTPGRSSMPSAPKAPAVPDKDAGKEEDGSDQDDLED